MKHVRWEDGRTGWKRRVKRVYMHGREERNGRMLRMSTFQINSFGAKLSGGEREQRRGDENPGSASKPPERLARSGPLTRFKQERQERQEIIGNTKTTHGFF